MSENHEKLLEEMRKSEVGVVSEAPPTLPQAHVRFQEPIQAPAPQAQSVQAPSPQAPNTEAPASQAPPTQAPPPNVQSLVSSLFSQMKDDSESDDSPRPIFKAPPTATSFPTKSAEKSDISQLLKNLGGGGSSSEDEDFPRPSAAKPRPPPVKSMMFQDDDDSADEFFR
ncbi:hypothetical protein B9Z55_021651 [Caenorhabditis nigoni]|nr:hypothetical protein B9Z55_021651 [Caenorhabditis nigoni]